MLCRHGFTVFAYDHTGCMESGGKTPGGLAHSLCDLNDCLSTLKRDPRFAGYDISVMGHSWGAFSTLNIPALHPDVSHIVAMCGFVSVEEMTNTTFSGLLKPYRKAILALESETNPDFVGYNAVNTLSDSSVKALLIYSEDDPMCRRTHYDILKAGLEGKENIRLMLCENKGHNPNYTKEAVKILNGFSRERAKLAKNKKATKEDKARFVEAFDWNAVTEQDEAVWQVIFEHLDN